MYVLTVDKFVDIRLHKLRGLHEGEGKGVSEKSKKNYLFDKFSD